MLGAMVATQGLDLIIATGWVAALTFVLLGRALISWRRFRRSSNLAVQARRLSEATRPVAVSRPRARPADVIPFKTASPVPAGQKSKI
jgi:hypothetical protein